MYFSVKTLLRGGKSPEKDSSYIFLFLFIFIGLLGAFNHSLWRDEMQGWLVAWRSDSLISLWKNNAPSGHPVLWSTLIYLVKNLTGTPLSMKLLHWLLGSMSMVVFWKWNPLPNWQKVIFTFGYYPFWEYFLVSRHYVLAQLFIFIFCSTYSFRRKSYLPAVICIGLLVNTHAFAWSLAFACGTVLLIDWILNEEQRSAYFNNKFWFYDLGISTLILSLLIAFAGFSLFQVTDTLDVIPSTLDFRHFLRVIGRIFGGYVLVIPDSSRWFDLSLCALFAFGFLASTLAFLSRSRTAFIFFLSGLGSLFLFNYFIYMGVGSRHYGYYFLILIAAIWISLHPTENKETSIFRTVHKPFINPISFTFPYLLTFCLSIHMAAGIHRTMYDFFVPYSAGQATANYILEKGWQDTPIFGTRDVEITTVAGYLDKDIYYPEVQGWGSYAQWNNRKPIKPEETLKYLNSFTEVNPDIDRFILLLSRSSAFRNLKTGDEMVSHDFKIIADRKFERSWTDPERFYLYWVERLK